MPRYRRSQGTGKLAAFHETLELALKADAHRIKQNRRTAKALFAQIRADGYTGCYSRVTDFIREWRVSEGKAPHARLCAVDVRAWRGVSAALRNGASFADMPAPLQRLRQGLMRHAGGDKGHV